jgi:MoaA/NifB/PqqE/SkfB family radical SAM enzyme
MDLNTLCPAPWLSIYRHTDGGVTPCCVFKGSLGNTNQDSVENIRNNQNFSKVKQAFLNGEKIPECNQCWKDETLNPTSSLRKTFLRNYKKYIDEIQSQKSLPVLYIDYRPSNTCNLACKSCSSEYSTQWLKIESELYNFQEGKILSNKIDVLSLLHNDVNIYFAGGEPLISKEVYDILEYLIEKNYLSANVSFNTNLTSLYFKEKSVIKLLEQFKNPPIIGASIDGIGNVFEYLRTGTSWQLIERNLKEVANTKLLLKPSCTVGWMNLSSMIELHIWLYENKIIKNIYDFNINPMYGPAGSSLLDCPPWKKEELLQKIEYYIKYLNDATYLSNDHWSSHHLPILNGQINICKNMLENSSYKEENFKAWIEKNLFIDDVYNRDIFSMPFMDEITKVRVLEIKNNFNKTPTFRREILT